MAEFNEKSVIVQLDANSKLGPDIVPGDPHRQSPNGKVLAGILERHAIIVVNSLREKCVNKITRSRITQEITEESIIDFVIVSEDLVENVENMIIDENKEHAIAKIEMTKNGRKVTYSDHNVILTNMNISWEGVSKEKEEFYNLKNKECQEVFKENTTENTKLSEVFDSKEDLNKCTLKFLKRLGRMIHKSFRKVRLAHKHDSAYDELYRRWKNIKKKHDKESIEEAQNIEKELADKYGNGLVNKIQHEVSGINCEEGGISSGNLWKLKNKVFNKTSEPPTAVVDLEGNVVTTQKGIMEENVKHFKEVLKNKPMKEELVEFRQQRESLAKARMKGSSQNKTPEWTMDDLVEVLRQLKRNKSRDPLGLLNDLFKPEVAGSDLKIAVLKLMNRIKAEQCFPECLELCNISSIFKNKGSRNLLNNYRGIFRVTVFRNILERLIYNDEYLTIDSNLTDCNVGARKGRNIRDNLFVLNAVLNSVKSGKEAAVDICVYDVVKCFDSLWTYECINDLYETGLQNDKLSLLFLMNQKAMVSVKTPCGPTDRTLVENIIMQGTVWGPMMATVTMDKLAKEVYKDEDLVYKYKGDVDIGVLQMIDDILTINKCENVASVSMNAKVNAFIETKKLKLGKTKCGRIHVGKQINECAKLCVHEEEMENSNEEKYLGDKVNSSGKPKETIEDRKNKGYAIVSQIMAMLKELPLGSLRVKVGLILREAWLVNGILFNSEVWGNPTKEDMRKLEVVDHFLLRSILSSHAKVPIEHLYLETGALPIPHVIKIRRLCYLKTILQRPESEVTRKVYEAQKVNSVKGDWFETQLNDRTEIELNMSDEEIQAMYSDDFKEHVKNKVRKLAFKELEERKNSHEKVRDNKYENLKHPQEYLISTIFSNEETSLLFALRSRTVRGIRHNFPYLALEGITVCPLCEASNDTQEHMLECPVLGTAPAGVKYSHLWGKLAEQKEIVVEFAQRIQWRNDHLEATED